MSFIHKILVQTSLLHRTRNGTAIKKIHQNLKLQNSASAKEQDVAACTSAIMEIGCKVALVNGGTSGIGLAAASQLLCNGAKNVAITGNDSCEGKQAVQFLNNTYGRGKATFINCNVNCMGQFEDAFKTTFDMYKCIDIVVNAVGILDGSQWEREIITNVVGTIRGTLLAYRYVGMEGMGKGGCVINIAGISGLQALPPAPTISASQHAIVGLSRSFGDSIHKNKSGVRVICLCPGFTQTKYIKHIAKRGMTDTLGKALEGTVKKAKKQGPDPCGHAVVHLIKRGKTGSVWICENSQLFLLNIPRKETYQSLVAQYL